jgi:hypothetical protein
MRRSPFYIALLTGLSLTAGLAAADPPAPLTDMFACADISHDPDRLDCYDNAVAQLRTAASAGELQAYDSSTLEAIERESFGFNLPSLLQLRRPGPAASPDRDNLNEIVGAIRSARSVNGRAVITLDNGQVWTQIDTTRVSALKLRNGGEARIRRAALGSYLMIIDNSGAAFRVRRTN